MVDDNTHAAAAHLAIGLLLWYCLWTDCVQSRSKRHPDARRAVIDTFTFVVYKQASVVVHRHQSETRNLSTLYVLRRAGLPQALMVFVCDDVHVCGFDFVLCLRSV